MTFKRISVVTIHLEASEPSVPALALQITQLVDSYMIWVGINEGLPTDVEIAPSKGDLSKDWACAMPPSTDGTLSPGTVLFRSSASDVALSMAQRLARRFGKPIFLSVGSPSSFTTIGQGPRLLLDAEKGIVSALSAIENKRGLSQ